MAAIIGLLSALSGLTVWADEAAASGADGENAGVMKEGSHIYANGVPILIKQGADGKAYVYDQSGTEKLLEDEVGPGTAIYGGGKNVPVEGDTSIVIDNVQTGFVYGGGYSDGSGNADVSGNVTVLIKGKVDASTVYGGGRADAAKGDASANVKGTASAKILADPTGNHGSIYGGGYASTSGSFQASAVVGNAYAQTKGRTYSLRGGGTAHAGGDGSARADVKGKISIQLDAVDIREVYGGGYASGKNAGAGAGSVEVIGNGNEMMILCAGGDADKGNADIAGNIRIELKNFSNLYGYIYGGGNAVNGGSANAGSVKMLVKDSITPVEEQFKDYWVCAAIYGGGTVDAASKADVAGSVEMEFTGDKLAGSILGGGEAKGDGSADVGSSQIQMSECSGIFVDELDDTFYASAAAGGEAEGDVPCSKAELTVSNSQLDTAWGGYVKGGQPCPLEGTAVLQVTGDKTKIREAGQFDTIELKRPLSLENFVPKKEGVPAVLIAPDMKIGETAIACGSGEAQAGWFALREGSLGYEKVENQSLWKIKEKGTVAIPPISTEVKPGVPDIAIKDKDAQSFLSEEDKTDIAAGSLIQFVVRVDKVESPSGEVVKEVKNALTDSGKTLGSYLDINLIKIKDGTESNISELGKSMEMTISVPEELLPDSDIKREFSVVHVHEEQDGTLVTTELFDQDDNDKTVTVAVDRLSTFALAYTDHGQNHQVPAANSEKTGEAKDKDSAAPSSANATSVQETPATGDDFSLWQWVLLALASGVIIFLCVRPFRKKEQ
ncbi:hypothetical protein NE619_12515 [Anaerovorax odorimutans]|uniref:Uncharacterized protein n=2 Tax=Anaerovorax odorimutans TaxID=109327 RepID=A0ABT1RQS7_9FIRM|nr:hypothetical protein [Anaerovorax odorimutans]